MSDEEEACLRTPPPQWEHWSGLRRRNHEDRSGEGTTGAEWQRVLNRNDDTLGSDFLQKPQACGPGHLTV